MMAENQQEPVTMWKAFREAMPVANHLAYYDHAAVGPLSGPAAQTMAQWAQEAAEYGDVNWPKWAKRLSEVRSQVAKGVNASHDEIAFVANTSDGISLVAQGLPWQSGDNIVLPEGEFPSNYYPWKALEPLGVEIRIVPTDEFGRFSAEQIRSQCDDKTRLIAVSWVGFASGFRCDVGKIAEVAREFNAYFFLDAIQGLGVFPLDLQTIGVDFLAADGHKWMLSPEGFGVFYVRRSVLEDLKFSRIGWYSVKQTFDYNDLRLDLKPNAQRFEAGSHNLVCAQALGASLTLLAQHGWGPDSSRLAERVISNRHQLAEVVKKHGGVLHTDMNDDHASGILSFSCPGQDPQAFRKHCLEHGIVLSCRNGRLRASIHGYNDESDLERFETALRSLK
jgi:cysteine desulfurase/selenocysteine lyase